ncbi:hypothetical protein EJD97_013282 [Solanum chilense]|uniref:Uncharacterized protein n=1 Tax=Solanum chilense TaxID=4083 RepID=A0A6N2AET5_SOLCI|nr:hypothetical protein EJD97_013282 [Solanum chilense]
MVRTRAKTALTPTPARQGVSEPTIGTATRGGAVERGRGRGRRRTPSRGTGRTPGPASNWAVNPPPTEKVVREGEEGENQQGQTPPVFSAPAPEIPGVQYAAVVAPRMDALLEVGKFPRLTTWSLMTSDQHELFTKFLKLKPPVFKDAESEDAYDFLVDCHELLQMIDIV